MKREPQKMHIASKILFKISLGCTHFIKYPILGHIFDNIVVSIYITVIQFIPLFPFSIILIVSKKLLWRKNLKTLIWVWTLSVIISLILLIYVRLLYILSNICIFGLKL